MDYFRHLIEDWYECHKKALFERTTYDPEAAHEEFITRSAIISSFGLSRLIFNCDENKLNPGFEISNAAGLNKNGDISPLFLKYLGFDRVVVGTVTKEHFDGNPRPRIVRYRESESLVNWQGLPGLGAEKVAANLTGYGKHFVPITINLMATPQKREKELIKDISHTIKVTRDVLFVDRFEYNISCPNTKSLMGSLDDRKEHLDNLDASLIEIERNRRSNQRVYLKVSPDLDEEGVEGIIESASRHGVVGFTLTNTTTNHDTKYIPISPGRGGASGNAVYERAKKIQSLFERKIDESGYDFKILAVGGINSAERALERTKNKRAIGIQIYTPLIFKGPRLIRELRRL